MSKKIVDALTDIAADIFSVIRLLLKIDDKISRFMTRDVAHAITYATLDYIIIRLRDTHSRLNDIISELKQGEKHEQEG